MKGKFRKRSSGVWCPKPKEKFKSDFPLERQLEIMKKCNGDSKKELLLLRSSGAFRMTRCSGWVNWSVCERCEFLEEFHLDRDGVFCLYGLGDV